MSETHTQKTETEECVCLCVCAWKGRAHQTPNRDGRSLGPLRPIQPTPLPEVRAAGMNSGLCPVGHRELVKVVEQGTDPAAVVGFGDMPFGGK